MISAINLNAKIERKILNGCYNYNGGVGKPFSESRI